MFTVVQRQETVGWRGLTAATVLLILRGFVSFYFVSKKMKKRKGNSWGRVALLVRAQFENCSELAGTGYTWQTFVIPSLAVFVISLALEHIPRECICYFYS